MAALINLRNMSINPNETYVIVNLSTTIKILKGAINLRTDRLL